MPPAERPSPAHDADDADDVEALEVRLLLEAIHARYGYDLREYTAPSQIRRARGALARSGLRSFGELQHALLVDSAVFARVLDDLMVHVTDMFREPGQYRVLRGSVLPILRTYPLLRIWHAGCATGEEAYATAIMLSEAGLYERAQIYASDLSPGALEQAEQGIYPQERYRVFADNYLDGGGSGDFARYWTKAYGGMAIAQPLRRNVLFMQHDLVADQVFGEMHLVFCRNVLIYFGKELRRRVLDKLVQSLCPAGFLCLGQSERLVTERDELGLVELDTQTRIYRLDESRGR